MARRDSRAGPKKGRVFIVDDHAIVRFGFRQLFDSQPDLEVCGEAEGIAQARAAIPRLKPDLVTADISLADGDGIELVRHLARDEPELPVLIVSVHEEAMHAELALNAGARGYIMKREALAQLLTAARQVLSGKIYLSEDMMQRAVARRTGDRRLAPLSPVERLSEREEEVFRMIGQWHPTVEIARNLKVSVKTVEYYRERIKEKLGLKTGVELLRYATEWCQQKTLPPANAGTNPIQPNAEA